MPTIRKHPSKRLPLYLIPILIGLAGVLFSRQLDHLGLRGVVLLFSVAIPVFAGGNLLARYQTGRRERTILVGGVLMLMLGAAVTVSGIADELVVEERVTEMVGGMSRLVGMLSLLLGLFVVLYSMVTTGEDIEEIGERFWHLAEHITEGFILSTSAGTITMVNRQFLDMCGLKEEEVLGQNAAELATRLNLSTVTEQLENRAKGIASEYEVDWKVRGEDRRFWFKGTPIFDRYGRHTATLATVRDITEYHRLSQRVERYAEGLQQLVEEQTRKLLRSDKRFRQLLITMNEGFVTIDASHRIQFANERIGELLHVPQEALLGRDIFDFVEAPARVRLLSLLARSETLDRTQMRQEMNLVDAEGNAVPIVMAMAHLPAETGSVSIYSLVVTGVAELKAMQHELESRARELERANEELRLHGQAKDRFLSNVSHELRTPLSTIQGYVDMLESGSLGMLPGPQTGALKVMRRNVARLIGHINEMIEFSRMQIRGIQLNIALFSPAKLVEESVASIHPHAVAKDISVTFFCPDNLPSAWGDSGKLAQALGILLNNAVKFTDEGGMVRAQVEVAADRTLRLIVSDTGIGIEAMYHQKVFEKFFQVDSSMTRRYEGTGIGLSIARSIVGAHSGAIELESVPGKGSTFTVVLPRALFDNHLDEGSLAPLHGLAVLLVDSGHEFTRVVRRVLEPAACKFGRSGNGYECVRAAKEFGPDIILINEGEADVAGQNSLGLLRQHPATATTPVLVFSSESGVRLHEIDQLWSHVLFLQNPFDAQNLTDGMKRLRYGESSATGLVTPSLPEPAPREPQVLVIDSDPGLLEWVEMALQLRHIPCCCTFTPQQALDIVATQCPDIIFLDADMPVEQVAEHLALLRQAVKTKEVPIYLVTGLDTYPRLQKEVAGFLQKPFTIDQIVAFVLGEAQVPVTPQRSAV
ncbi:MAG: PAS domain S-box protein [Candidatus Hydrogenedentes bacterium]|nr:PAS domain S-box protein [Candidatus Hydrogenedentota bacterium]